ncbi:hypothetical protein [Streptomyces noursei]|uniref:hypothetical protein n=1 Tax=Streptomyces noursei TaxID=1971 RepID=UPI0008364AB6
MRLFPVPETGVQLLITVHAPALIITPKLQQEVTVLPGRDSDVLRFGIQANQPGLHEVTVRAFRVGTFLGEVRCQISVDPGGTSRGGPQYSTELETLAFDPGEVTLQVLRNGPGSFTFQLLSETCYAPVTYQARDFADAFYDQLITRGKPLGQASLAARQAIRSPDGDPTWLAYAVYGSPAATAHTRT